jgi:hypothetical protein
MASSTTVLLPGWASRYSCITCSPAALITAAIRSPSLVVIDGDVDAAVSWQFWSLALAVSRVTNAVGPPRAVSPRQCTTCTARFPLTGRVRHHRPRSDRIRSGVVGNRRTVAQRLESESR